MRSYFTLGILGGAAGVAVAGFALIGFAKPSVKDTSRIEIELTKELDLEKRIDALEFRIETLELESSSRFKKGDKQQ